MQKKISPIIIILILSMVLITSVTLATLGNVMVYLPIVISNGDETSATATPTTEATAITEATATAATTATEEATATATEEATATATATVTEEATATATEEATATATEEATATATEEATATATEEATATATEEATATATEEATATATPTATATATSPPGTGTWLDSWMVNTTGETSTIFTGVTVNVSSTYTQTINGKPYQCITASGIPNYETTMSQELIDSLNSRPRASTDFGTGETTATVGQTVPFGANIGYSPSMGCSAGQDGYGYWPPGPSCPTNQNKDQCFPLEPEPTTEVCETGLASIGTWVNGVALFNWTDGMSYNGQQVWDNEAFHFEFYDLDICPGHSAMGDYHHHSHPVCLAEQLNDTGTGHSPIYGFGADGYPIYGPWHDSDVLANSCWKTRDYDDPTSETGCGVAGERSCLLVDQLDISQGTIVAQFPGPDTDDLVTSLSGNQFVATSGYYLQDYYYDPSCTAQGVEYMDKHNGHSHDGLGYHYHITRAEVEDGSYTDVFPFYIGPTYAGTLQDEAIGMCGGGPPPPPPPPPPGGATP